MAEPFAGGYFEGQLDVVATELPDNDAGLSGEDWVAAHPDTAQEYAEQCFAAAGVTGRPAQRMARAALTMRDEQGITLRAAMTQVYLRAAVLCARHVRRLFTHHAHSGRDRQPADRGQNEHDE